MLVLLLVQQNAEVHTILHVTHTYHYIKKHLSACIHYMACHCSHSITVGASITLRSASGRCVMRRALS